MTTTKLITALRDVADECEDLERIRLCREAADRLEEQDEIIKQYKKADCFLAAHGNGRKGEAGMTTDELIIVLRESAESDELSFRYARKLLKEAADRLEELDERVSIMSKNGMTAWELFEMITSAYGGKQIFFRQENGIIYDRYKADYITFNEALSRFCAMIGDDGIDC